MPSLELESILAAAPSTERAMPAKLDADSKGQRIAYASGKSIFLRSIDNPADCKQFTGHTDQTTAARFSPSGHYVASGDTTGKVRVWDAITATTNKEPFPVISGPIKDIAWDGDSQRLIAVGWGSQSFGKAFLSDSGNSVGTLSGHSGRVNAAAVNKQRPVRAATVSETGEMCFFGNLPFKLLKKYDGVHKGYVHAAAFSPDNALLATVGGDRQIHVYDGKTGESIRIFGADVHKGSVFAVAWAKDSERIVTASADQTARAWNAKTGELIQTWEFGTGTSKTVYAQQVGIVWPHGRDDDLIISLSSVGTLSYLKIGEKEPIRIIYGHNKAITALEAGSDGKGQDLWSGSFDGRVCHWDLSKGLAAVVGGTGHSNRVVQFATSPGSGQTFSTGWDDRLRAIDEGARTFTDSGDIELSAQPQGVASSADGRIFVALASGKVAVYLKEKLIAELPVDGGASPSAVAVHGSLVVVGTAGGHRTLVYQVGGSGDKWELVKELKETDPEATALSFSKDGKHLVSGTSRGKLTVYDTSSWLVATERWSAHSSRITSVAWNAAGTHAVTGSLDTHIYVWSLEKPGQRVKALNAHKDGVSGVAWVDGDKKIASAGSDATVKTWTVSEL